MPISEQTDTQSLSPRSKKTLAHTCIHATCIRTHTEGRVDGGGQDDCISMDSAEEEALLRGPAGQRLEKAWRKFIDALEVCVGVRARVRACVRACVRV